MNSKLILKEKTHEKVVYYYSADTSTYKKKFGEIIPDGEIECVIVPDEPGIIECTTLKKATNDETGFHAEWLYNHLWGVIFEENCPEKRFIAIG